MKSRIILLVAAAALVAGSLIPTAAAQLPDPYLKFTTKWTMQHTMTLKDNGRDTMEVDVELEAKDWICHSQYKLTVEVVLAPFAKWAGASLQPTTVDFTIEPQRPGFDATPYKRNAKTIMDIAWNVEDRPKKGAEQAYVTTPKGKKDDPGTGFPCASSPRISYHGSTPMLVRMDDVVESVTHETKCVNEPWLPECAPTVEANEGDGAAPPINGAIFALALLAMIAVLRRRRA